MNARLSAHSRCPQLTITTLRNRLGVELWDARLSSALLASLGGVREVTGAPGRLPPPSQDKLGTLAPPAAAGSRRPGTTASSPPLVSAALSFHHRLEERIVSGHPSISVFPRLLCTPSSPPSPGLVAANEADRTSGWRGEAASRSASPRRAPKGKCGGGGGGGGVAGDAETVGELRSSGGQRAPSRDGWAGTPTKSISGTALHPAPGPGGGALGAARRAREEISVSSSRRCPFDVLVRRAHALHIRITALGRLSWISSLQ